MPFRLTLKIAAALRASRRPDPGRLAACLLAAVLPAQLHAAGFLMDDDEREPWVELQAKLPAPPNPSNLIEFFGGKLTQNHFFVDSESIDVGTDGVVRYTQVVRTEGGATNVTFEGMRCSTSEMRLYAIGGRDGIWTEARDSRWKPVNVGATKNRNQGVLARDVFCPDNSPVRNKAEAIRNLKQSFQARERTLY